MAEDFPDIPIAGGTGDADAKWAYQELVTMWKDILHKGVSIDVSKVVAESTQNHGIQSKAEADSIVYAASLRALGATAATARMSLFSRN